MNSGLAKLVAVSVSGPVFVFCRDSNRDLGLVLETCAETRKMCNPPQPCKHLEPNISAC